ncbi:hypothetical protein [Legionella sainthelensi]|uniref:Uncharacterized protein n=1 Tax=Legionella sainthelensi TaxID=28087 RepID=A0A2H5FM51_9GAMM|nr:hypothetical protein [Legionella sainthelensi]AUH72631.1 hypothetical protein CAB17_11655 [Legionella sainthelensi]
MITVYKQWETLSTKLAGLINAVTLFYQIPQKDHLGTAKLLKKEIKENIELIIKFQESANTPYLSELIDSFSKEISASLDSASRGEQLDQQNIKLIIQLTLLKNNIDYFLKDSQRYIRKTVEVAFQHLQRSLIADQSLRDVWKKDKKEVHFEKLGSTHLLLHKIWAFKVDSAGERTDLVLSEKIDKDSPLYDCVDGLVLTEWKYVKDQTQMENLIEQAKTQAKLYSGGALNSIELSNYYYLVMVSEDLIFSTPRTMEDESGIIFRIINIAFSPSTPSVASKKMKT